MAYTPLIKRLNSQGTTFYTFSSSAMDLSKCIGNSTTKEFVFSHYVCLDIPDFVAMGASRTTDLVANFPQVSSYINTQQTKTSSYLLACHLQNYVYNFEEKLISDPTVTQNGDRNFAEMVFWHWLQKTGAVGFQQGSSAKVAQNRTRYVETPVADQTAGGYLPPVVKFIGNIDVTNNVEIGTDAYTEVYVHVPNDTGYTPTVLFDTDQSFAGTYDTNVTAIPQPLILGQNIENTQFVITDQDPTDLTYCGIFDQGTAYTPSNGYFVDFDATSYQEIMANAAISNFHEYAASDLSDSFEFNTVLVYYDVIDVSSGERTSNLYGVLFLDDVTKTPTNEYIQRFPKYKPVEGVMNGNSYGFKINLRIDIEPNKQGISTLVNEYNTFSMSLFADAMAKIQNCATSFLAMRGRLNTLEDRLASLENLIGTVADYNQLREQVRQLGEELENANLAFSDRNTLLELIGKNSDEIQRLAQGGLSSGLTLNLDVVKPGYNMEVDTNTPNQITINSRNYGYSLCTLVNKTSGEVIDKEHPLDLGDPNSHCNETHVHLQPSANMLRFYTDPSSLSLYDIVIYVNDTLNSWRDGQALRVSFPELTLQTLNATNIVLLTDANNKGGNGQYGVKNVVSAAELKSDFPIIEFVCTDGTMSSQHPIVHDIIR